MARARVALIVAFVALTAYDVTVNGYFEPAALFPPHYTAGAGSSTLLIRAALCVLVVFTQLASLLRATNLTRAASVGIAIAAPILFVWSLDATERVAPHFSEAAFDAVTSRAAMTKQDVLAQLGSPLIAGRCDNRECWSYVYMPSGGFGGRTRIVIFDDRGRIADHIRKSEP